MFTKTKPYKRTDRVSDQLRVIVSEIISHKLHHAGLGGMTITRVDVSPDMRHAKAFYRTLDPSTQTEVKRNLKKILPQIQREVGAQMETKYTPSISFLYDEGIDHQDRIFQLLDRVRSDEQSPESEE